MTLLSARVIQQADLPNVSEGSILTVGFGAETGRSTTPKTATCPKSGRLCELPMLTVTWPGESIV